MKHVQQHAYTHKNKNMQVDKHWQDLELPELLKIWCFKMTVYSNGSDKSVSKRHISQQKKIRPSFLRVQHTHAAGKGPDQRSHFRQPSHSEDNCSNNPFNNCMKIWKKSNLITFFASTQEWPPKKYIFLRYWWCIFYETRYLFSSRLLKVILGCVTCIKYDTYF